MARGDTVNQVRLLAAQQQVSERTVYRWFAAMRQAGTTELLQRLRDGWACACCNEPLPTQATIRRRYCDNTCRQAADRHRRSQRTHRPAGRHT